MSNEIKPWKELGRSRSNPTGDGRVAFFEVPELNLVAVIQVPNGGVDDECDKLRSKIVRAVNEYEAMVEIAKNSEAVQKLFNTYLEDDNIYASHLVGMLRPHLTKQDKALANLASIRNQST